MSIFRRSSSLLSVAAGLLAAGLFAPAANAQAQAPSSQPPSTQAPSPSAPAPGQPGTSIPDQKLDQAAAALQQVAGLKHEYEQRVDSANESDKQNLINEANSKMAKAITDQGLSVQEYTAIIVIAQNDATVRDKLLQRLPQAGNSAGQQSPSSPPK
jgi:uncharacterized protein DUF4168